MTIFRIGEVYLFKREPKFCMCKILLLIVKKTKFVFKYFVYANFTNGKQQGGLCDVNLSTLVIF